MTAAGSGAGAGAGRLFGVACAVAGALLFAGAAAGLASPAIARTLPLLPFFDRLYRWSAPQVAIPMFCAAALLLVNAWAILGRRRIATWLYPASGWIGFVFTAAAAWPGSNLHGKLEFALGAMKKQGRLPAEATISDLLSASVPGWVVAVLGLLLVVWLGLLILGTLHFTRGRGVYAA